MASKCLPPNPRVRLKIGDSMDPQVDGDPLGPLSPWCSACGRVALRRAGATVLQPMAPWHLSRKMNMDNGTMVVYGGKKNRTWDDKRVCQASSPPDWSKTVQNLQN